MSNPGFVMQRPPQPQAPGDFVPQQAPGGAPGGVSTDQLTPEFLRQMQLLQSQQKKSDMAQALMGGGNADPRTQYAGLANAGSSIMGAALQNRANQQADPQNAVLQQRYGIDSGAANNILHPSMLSKLFNLGGS